MPKNAAASLALMNSDSMVGEGVWSTDLFLCASPRIVAATVTGEPRARGS